MTASYMETCWQSRNMCGKSTMFHRITRRAWGIHTVELVQLSLISSRLQRCDSDVLTQWRHYGPAFQSLAPWSNCEQASAEIAYSRLRWADCKNSTISAARRISALDIDIVRLYEYMYSFPVRSCHIPFLPRAKPRNIYFSRKKSTRFTPSIRSFLLLQRFTHACLSSSLSPASSSSL